MSTALAALRERPRSQHGLQSEEEILPLDYIASVGVDSRENGARKRGRSGGKLRMAFNLPEELCERARNAVWHLSGRIQLNLSSLTEGTLEREITRLEKKYNDGKPFPTRAGRLKGGPLRRRTRAARRTEADATADR